MIRVRPSPPNETRVVGEKGSENPVTDSSVIARFEFGWVNKTGPLSMPCAEADENRLKSKKAEAMTVTQRVNANESRMIGRISLPVFRQNEFLRRLSIPVRIDD